MHKHLVKRTTISFIHNYHYIHDNSLSTWYRIMHTFASSVPEFIAAYWLVPTYIASMHIVKSIHSSMNLYFSFPFQTCSQP